MSSQIALPTDAFIATLASTSVQLRERQNASEAEIEPFFRNLDKALKSVLADLNEELLQERDDYVGCMLRDGTYARAKKKTGKGLKIVNTTGEKTPSWVQDILETHSHLIKRDLK